MNTSMPGMPLISVIIPTYNYANYITEAIDSVLNQEYPKDKIEIIVVDDGSTDNTKDVLKDFIQNNVIKYFYQQNEGKASATYKAIQQATGKYIFNLDADDYFLACKIKRTVEVFESDESIVHVATPAKQILPDGTIRFECIPDEFKEKKIPGSRLLQYFMRNNILYGGGTTYAVKAAVLKNIPIPRAVDMYIDEFLIVAILPHGNSYFIKEPLSVWRGHNLNYSNIDENKTSHIIKGKRLLSSSNALLEFLKNNHYDADIVKIYTLKNVTAALAYKELLNTKEIKDIVHYAFEIFFKLKPGWSVLKKYHALNRLIPTPVFNILKRQIKKKQQAALLTL